MKTDRKSISIRQVFLHLLLTAEAAAVTGIMSYFASCSYGEILRRCVGIVIGTQCFIFSSEQELRLKRQSFQSGFPRRAQLCFALLLPLAAFLSALPVTAWIYPFLFTLLSVLGGPFSAACGGSTLLMLSVSLAGAPAGVFFLYFAASLISVAVYAEAEEACSSLMPLLCRDVCFFILLFTLTLFYTTGGLNVERFIVPAAAVTADSVLMLILIWRVNYGRLDKRRRIFSGLNDQTAPLMERLKTEAPDLYMRAIHVSHFTDVLGECLGADPYLCRGGGYYAQLPLFPDAPEKTAELRSFMTRERMPGDLQELILSGGRTPFPTVECMIVTLAGELVDDILKYKAQGEDVSKLYEELVEMRMQEIYCSDALSRLPLRFCDFAGAEKALLDEKKYVTIM